MSDYTPTTGTIRQSYTGEPCGDDTCTLGEIKNAEFDRWLAEHDRQVAAKALPENVVNLLWSLTDRDDCWFDHHGGCQAHGYLSLEPGEKCPHAEAKQLLMDLTVGDESVTADGRD